MNKIPKNKNTINHTNKNEKTVTVGGEIRKDGTKQVKNKDNQTKKITDGKNEISNNHYTCESHEVSGGVNHNKDGTTVNGSYTHKNTYGQQLKKRM